MSAIVTMVNDRVIKATINPLETGSFPYRVMPWDQCLARFGAVACRARSTRRSA